jgi:hypothetical protein
VFGLKTLSKNEENAGSGVALRDPWIQTGLGCWTPNDAGGGSQHEPYKEHSRIRSLKCAYATRSLVVGRIGLPK